jgi:hypothetical protein
MILDNPTTAVRATNIGAHHTSRHRYTLIASEAREVADLVASCPIKYDETMIFNGHLRIHYASTGKTV